MTCRYATQTERTAFDDLTPERGVSTHFVCRCGFNECRHPDRVPPAVRQFDAAGIHSSDRYQPDGKKKEDYIIVKRKYCRKECCSNYEVRE